MLTPQTSDRAAASAQGQTRPPTDPEVDLRTKVLIALRWTALTRFLGQLIAWTITLHVIRILSPADYGLMAMAGVPIAFFYLLNTAGLDAALVQKRDLTEARRAQIFGVVITVNLLFCIALLGVGPWIAAFYSDPRLTAIIRVLSLQFILLAFETLPQSQLEREISFGARSMVELVTTLTGSLTALVLAHAGLGVWTLVWTSVVTTTIRVLGLNLVQPFLCWPSFSLTGMTKELRFGRSASVDRVVRFTLDDTDKLIGGRVLGNTLLGHYAVASDLASLPIRKVTGLINAIALPAFAQTQSDPRGAEVSLLTVSRLMSLLTFPLFLGLSSVAHELTALLLGPKWQAVAAPLQLVSLVMPLRMLMNTFQPLLWGIGRPERSISTFLIGALIMPAAFFAGAHWGPVGLGIAWVVAYPVVFLISVAHAEPVTGVPVSVLCRTIARPALASAFMYVGVFAARRYVVTAPSGGLGQLVNLVLLGAISYAGAMLILDRPLLREAGSLVRGFLSARARAPRADP